MSNEESVVADATPGETPEEVGGGDAGSETTEASDAAEAAAQGSDAPAEGADPVAEERDKLKQQLMRTAADFDNFRRRSRREVEEARMKGKDDAVVELLPVIDNLERAVQASEGATDVEAVLSGVQMVLKLFEDTASRMGLNRVKSVGERFDPAMHDAIQQQETTEHPAGSIVAEVAAGYMFGKRLIRPAMVVVARAPKPAAVPEPVAEEVEEAGPGAEAATEEASNAEGETGANE